MGTAVPRTHGLSRLHPLGVGLDFLFDRHDSEKARDSHAISVSEIVGPSNKPQTSASKNGSGHIGIKVIRSPTHAARLVFGPRPAAPCTRACSASTCAAGSTSDHRPGRFGKPENAAKCHEAVVLIRQMGLPRTLSNGVAIGLRATAQCPPVSCASRPGPASLPSSQRSEPNRNRLQEPYTSRNSFNCLVILAIVAWVRRWFTR